MWLSRDDDYGSSEADTVLSACSLVCEWVSVGRVVEEMMCLIASNVVLCESKAEAE